MAAEPPDSITAQRIDQWLWFSRIVKSRTLAQSLIERGKVRLNRARIEKCAQSVKAGDVITISLGPKVRVLEIKALGTRRGPAPEAALLYLELTADDGASTSDQKRDRSQKPAEQPSPATRPQGTGRPTKRDRRAIDKLKAFDR